MKKYIFFSLLLMLNTAHTLDIDPAGVQVNDRVVVVEASVQEYPPQITINFLGTYYDNYDYEIYRRDLHGYNWGTKIVTLPANTTSWTDTNVSVGDVYEYQIRKKTSTNRDAIGYVAAGIRYDQTDYKGRMILLIDNTIITPLSTEIEQLKTDLVGDGWFVETIEAERVEGWNGGQAVTVVKQQIVNVYNAAPANDKPKLLFILGHIPVARSGLHMETSDNHSENEGANATDAYYADIDGIWTDTGTYTSPNLESDEDQNQTVLADPNNINLPGDYKWDQYYLPSELELGFGRVDFADLAKPAESEIELYRRYLNKLHNYRHVANGYDVGRTIAIRAKGYPEGLDLSYRNGVPIVGSTNMLVYNDDDWLTKTGHANWVNNNGPFLGYFQNQWKPEINAIDQQGGLNALLYISNKSYWGLWGKESVPVRDNGDEWLGHGLCRAVLATGGLNLVVLWGTSPAASIFFQTAIGETLGYSIKRSIDHHNDQFNIFEYHGRAQGYDGYYPDGHLKLRHSKTPHLHYNGDPSIRFFPVKPASNLVATNNSDSVSLTWNASQDNNIIGYHVYRSNLELGQYTKLTTAPVTTNSYTDNNPLTGDNWYMLRAIKLDTTGSGSFLNPSQGIFATAVIDDGTPSSTVAPASNLVATIKNNSTVSLTWNASPDNEVTGYEVYHSTTESGDYTKLTTALISTTSYTDKNPLIGENWYVVVAIKPDTNGNTLSSDGIFVQAVIQAIPPKPALNLVASVNNNTVSLTWNASPDNEVTGYEVYHSTTESGDYTKLTTTPVTSTSYTDNNPLIGDNWYMVKAIKQDASGNTLSSDGIFVKAIILDPTTVAPPSNLVATIKNNNTVSLTWKASPDNEVTGYEVYHSTTESGDYTKLTTALITTTSYTDKNPLIGDNWYVVVAIKPDTNGNTLSSHGIFVQAVIQATPPEPASNLVASINNNTVSLTWNASPDNDITGYNVYISSTEFGEYTKLTTTPVTTTSYTDNYPITGDNWYKVTAIKQDTSGNTLSSDGIFVKAVIETTASSTITIDFEDLPLGIVGTTGTYNNQYDDPKGFTFRDDLNDILRIYGTSNNYASQILHPNNWSRQIFITRTNGGTFDLKSFEYGADIWHYSVDATVTGYLTSGGTVSQTYTTSSKNMQTLNLNWENLSSVKIDFATGNDGNYGALDNFVLVAK